MEKDIVILDHISLLKTYEVHGSKIKELSKGVDRMFRAMSRRREALERMVKVKRIFNI